ncbi:glycosyl hydrolase [Streptomyces sp. TRM43335]|uniref:beta-glucosidase n=1 Tax=Streptomyces taklimakanensis TaxID=2569853 RepID=A0A6G2B779_9ACTN|nr:glycoside hydrolase family 3 N-terminal domain-containing protein [Streptomyces taklimakanensis]MTE17933.1 glycosyl hydrolase [Streptomyces taklimakanensis]
MGQLLHGRPDHRRRRTRTALGTLGALLALLASGLTPTAAAAEPTRTVDDFDGTFPGPIGTYGSNAEDTPAISQVPAEARPGANAFNRAMRVEYGISAWGGFDHSLTATEDWSGFEGLSFWVKGTGSGQRVQFEVKDGGPNAGQAELWAGYFTDDTDDWKQVKTPFEDFVRRPDYQPAGAPSDGTLELTDMWGYAVNLPAASGTLEFDQVELYGVGGVRARVATDSPVYTVDHGDTATVKVSVGTTGNVPLAEPVTVRYGTGEGTARPGEDYTPVEGTLTFPAGTPSGAVKTFTVTTKRNAEAATAKTIPITLTVDGGRAPTDPPTVVVDAHGLPYLDPRLPVEKRVRDLLSRMTVDEKIGQMTQAERGALETQDDIAGYELGSLLSGGGSNPTPNTPEAWADMVDGFQLRAQQTRLQIPLIYGVDAVHGHNNVVGATIFPHNTGLGAARDPELVEDTAHVTAEEVRATGIPWNFSPCLCVSRDERWGRAYEAYSEDPALVTRLATAVEGHQGRADGSDLKDADRVLATAKHYVGDGGTEFGSSTTGTYTIDQGVTRTTRQELEAVHIAPFVEAVDEGVGTVMPSFSSVDFLGDGEGPVKMHAHADLITDVLKGELGFDGFVISDWQAIDQIPGDYASDVRTSINAGLDMIMVPYDYKAFTSTLREQVDSGAVPMSRIDDAVARILTKKFQLGLFEKPYADRTHLDEVGSAEHRGLAREAAADSQVLLKNDGDLLPLKGDEKLYVAGSNADDLGNQSGGWTITWQGTSGDITEGTTILEGLGEVAPEAEVTFSEDASAPTGGHEVGVVVVGETPYAEGVGDVGNGHDLRLSDADRKAIDTVCGAMDCAVLIVSGRPQIVTDQLGDIDALVASWLPGSEGAGVADTLFGERPFTGRLPVSWPRSAEQVPVNVGDREYAPLYPYGWGLRTDSARDRLAEVRDDLLDRRRDGAARAAAAHLRHALKGSHWRADGTVRDAHAVLRSLGKAAGKLERVKGDPYLLADEVVSVARDIAQAALLRAGDDASGKAVARTADADHALASGEYAKAVRHLTEAHRLAR